jgi:hypothetical protein
MNKRRYFAITAGVLYLVLGVFTGIILVRWSASGVSEAVRFLEAAPEFLPTFVVVPILAAGSFLMGVVILRGKLRPGVLIAGFIVAAVSIVWSLAAFLLWLLPVPFLWAAQRESA